jgi:hypothetical protein
MVRLCAPRRARVAVVLSVLILFFGVAIFSPLHQHSIGKSNSCSFNNLEHQMVSLAEAAISLSTLAFVLEHPVHEPAECPRVAVRSIAQDRAPPQFS